MSKDLAAPLAAHYLGSTTTLASLWKVTRRDGLVFGFTNHDAAITYDGTVYAPSSAFDPSAIGTKSELNVDNMEVLGLLSSEGVQSEDIEAGLWDGAAMEIVDVNWADVSMGANPQRFGEIGQVQRKEGQFVAELRGLKQKFQVNIGRSIAPTCDATLGDARCKVDLEGSPGYRVVGTVFGLQSRRAFNAELTADDGYYSGGEVTFTSGANVGIRMEVRVHTATGSPVDEALIELQLPVPFEIGLLDEFTIVPGCPKTKAACIAKFDNLLNFRGFSFVPGNDAILLIGGQE